MPSEQIKLNQTRGLVKVLIPTFALLSLWQYAVIKELKNVVIITSEDTHLYEDKRVAKVSVFVVNIQKSEWEFSFVVLDSSEKKICTINFDDPASQNDNGCPIPLPKEDVPFRQREENSKKIIKKYNRNFDWSGVGAGTYWLKVIAKKKNEEGQSTSDLNDKIRLTIEGKPQPREISYPKEIPACSDSEFGLLPSLLGIQSSDNDQSSDNEWNWGVRYQDEETKDHVWDPEKNILETKGNKRTYTLYRRDVYFYFKVVANKSPKLHDSDKELEIYPRHGGYINLNDWMSDPDPDEELRPVEIIEIIAKDKKELIGGFCDSPDFVEGDISNWAKLSQQLTTGRQEDSYADEIWSRLSSNDQEAIQKGQDPERIKELKIKIRKVLNEILPLSLMQNSSGDDANVKINNRRSIENFFNNSSNTGTIRIWQPETNIDKYFELEGTIIRAKECIPLGKYQLKIEFRCGVKEKEEVGEEKCCKHEDLRNHKITLTIEAKDSEKQEEVSDKK